MSPCQDHVLQNAMWMLAAALSSQCRPIRSSLYVESRRLLHDFEADDHDAPPVVPRAGPGVDLADNVWTDEQNVQLSTGHDVCGTSLQSDSTHELKQEAAIGAVLGAYTTGLRNTYYTSVAAAAACFLTALGLSQKNISKAAPGTNGDGHGRAARTIRRLDI